MSALDSLRKNCPACKKPYPTPEQVRTLHWDGGEALCWLRDSACFIGLSMPTECDEERVVAGRRMKRSIADFVRSCEVEIERIARAAAGDTAVLALLCDAVRLAREYVDSQRNSV